MPRDATVRIEKSASVAIPPAVAYAFAITCHVEGGRVGRAHARGSAADTSAHAPPTLTPEVIDQSMTTAGKTSSGTVASVMSATSHCW